MHRLLALTSLLLATQGASFSGTLYAVNDDTRELLAIDTSTLALNVVGNLGVTDGFYGDLAYDAGSDTLYWVAGRDNNSLYTINRATGAATLVGSHGLNDLFALAFNPLDGLLYAQTTEDGVYTMNPGTAATTLIGTNNVYPGGYAWNSATNQLILSQSGNLDLYAVSTTDGSATLLNNSVSSNDNDVDYDLAANVYWVADYNGNLIRVNASDFTTATVLTGIGNVAAVALVDDVPEPGTVLLTLIGLGGLLVLRRRA